MKQSFFGLVMSKKKLEHLIETGIIQGETIRGRQGQKMLTNKKAQSQMH